MIQSSFICLDGMEYDYDKLEPFGVDNATGSVRTRRNFDKSNTGYFTLEIEAFDSLKTAFSDQATVSVC